MTSSKREVGSITNQEGQGLPPFRHELEKQPPKPGVDPGGTTRQASAPHEFYVSVGIACASMRLLDIASASMLVIALLPSVHGSLVGRDPTSPSNPFPLYAYGYQ